MKNPTAEELAVLRERAERTFSRFPVLPRREDGRMSPESRLRFELTLETILEKNRALGACVVLRRPSGAHETFCFGTARLLGRSSRMEAVWVSSMRRVTGASGKRGLRTG